jgi:Leucine-rich repeat (LRR) protein
VSVLKQNVGRARLINLLLVNDSSVGHLGPAAFSPLRIHSLQLSDCGITHVADNALAGQEESLVNLNLAGNQLTVAPVEALRNLRRLSLLDLSRNQLTFLPDQSFVTLKLQVLKLSDNPELTFGDRAFRGLERALKNLNLKNTG